MADGPPLPDSAPPARSSPLRAAAGFALLAPALVCCAAQLAFPTFQTFIMSFRKVNLLTPPAFVGLQNYSALLGNRVFFSAFGFTLMTTVARVLAVAIVPLMLALGVSAFGRSRRLGVRVLFTIPMALFMPVAIALAWWVALMGQRISGLSSPTEAPFLLILIDAIHSLGLACGVGLIFYLAALRGRGAGRRWVLLAATWIVGLVAAVALSLQSFTLSYVLTRGGPVGATTTLMLLYYQLALVQFNFGPAAALGVMLVIVLAIMGLLVGAIIVFTRLQLTTTTDEQDGEPFAGKTLGIGLFIVALLLASPACALGVAPVFAVAARSMAKDAYQQFVQAIPLGSVVINTLWPVLLSVFVQVLVTYFGALGIGGLRPLGRRSEFLLLLFSPWLLVSARPLTAAIFQAMAATKSIGSWMALIPPISLNIPMLFILTLFFRGQRARAEESAAPSLFTNLILLSLPLTAFLACAALWAGLQDAWWPLIAADQPGHYTAQVALMNLAAQSFSEAGPVAAGLVLFSLPSFLFFFVVFSAFQVLYLDRLQLVAGEEETATPADSAA